MFSEYSTKFRNVSKAYSWKLVLRLFESGPWVPLSKDMRGKTARPRVPGAWRGIPRWFQYTKFDLFFEFSTKFIFRAGPCGAGDRELFCRSIVSPFIVLSCSSQHICDFTGFDSKQPETDELFIIANIIAAEEAFPCFSCYYSNPHMVTRIHMVARKGFFRLYLRL